MYPHQLTDNLPESNLSLSSSSNNERELLLAVANLLYTVKDVQKATRIINNAAKIVVSKPINQESYSGC
jgi:hypothetical protein